MSLVEFSLWSFGKIVELSIKTVTCTITSTISILPKVYKWYKKESYQIDNYCKDYQINNKCYYSDCLRN